MKRFLRSIHPGGWLLISLTSLWLISNVKAQLSQSGGPGSSVTLLAGSAIAGKVGIDQTTPGTTNAMSLAQIGATTVATGNGTSGAGDIRVNIASDNTAFPVNATIAAAIPAGSNVIGTVNTIPKTACGNTVASQALVAVPTSATAVFASTTCLEVVVLNNITSGALTVTITDNQGTPVNDVLTFSIPAFSQLIQPLWGVAFTTGVKWTASGAGVTGAILGYQ